MSDHDDDESGQVLRLERTITSLQAQVDQLQAAVTVFIDPFSLHPGCWPWLYHPLPKDLTDLDEWVGWANRVYVVANGDLLIPECWASHPAFAAEVTTLWCSWRAAFTTAEARPDDAQNWHDRWLPGFIHRRSVWTNYGACRDGRCRPASHAPINHAAR